jgi:hypothetical protein
MARKAGSRQASADTQHKMTTTTAYVTASRHETPNNIAAINELEAVAPRRPTRTPEPVSLAPCRTTRPGMLPRDAPNAIRTPNGRVRSATFLGTPGTTAGGGKPLVRNE